MVASTSPAGGELILTLSCPDRRGIVARVAGFVAERDGNIIDSHQFGDPDAGVFFMVFCLAAVVLSDAGAYFAGRAWGRRKLAPKISPGKTVEGALGGIAVGALGAGSRPSGGGSGGTDWPTPGLGL